VVQQVYRLTHGPALLFLGLTDAGGVARFVGGVAARQYRTGWCDGVIATLGGPGAAGAAEAATKTIPIVFEIAPDPVAIGLVASFSKPGGNATGFSIMAGETEPKLLGLLHELLPGAKQFAELVLQINEERATNLRRAAAMIGAQIAFLQATNIREIDLAFAELAQKHVDALLVSPPPFSLTVPCKSRRLPHATPYPPFISSANSQRWAA
jgi:ABC transporter substrate binding protein